MFSSFSIPGLNIDSIKKNTLGAFTKKEPLPLNKNKKVNTNKPVQVRPTTNKNNLLNNANILNNNNNYNSRNIESFSGNNNGKNQK